MFDEKTQIEDTNIYKQRHIVSLVVNRDWIIEQMGNIVSVIGCDIWLFLLSTFGKKLCWFSPYLNILIIC